MNQTNQVQEVFGLKKIIEYIKLALEPLTTNDGMSLDKIEGLEEIEKATDMEKINKLEENMGKVHIPLDEKNFVKKEKVSSEKAKEIAESKAKNRKEKEKNQQQREN